VERRGVTCRQINDGDWRSSLAAEQSVAPHPMAAMSDWKKCILRAVGTRYRASQSKKDVIESTCHGVPLLCHVSASGRCRFKIPCMAPKSLPCGLVAGKPFKLARFVIGRFATHSSAGIYATKLSRNISLPFSRYHKRMACFGPRDSSTFRIPLADHAARCEARTSERRQPLNSVSQPRGAVPGRPFPTHPKSPPMLQRCASPVLFAFTGTPFGFPLKSPFTFTGIPRIPWPSGREPSKTYRTGRARQMTSFPALSVVVPVPAGQWIHTVTVFRIAPARAYVTYLIWRAVTATMGLAADLIGFQFLPAPSTPRMRVRARTVQDPFC